MAKVNICVTSLDEDGGSLAVLFTIDVEHATKDEDVLTDLVEAVLRKRLPNRGVVIHERNDTRS